MLVFALSAPAFGQRQFLPTTEYFAVGDKVTIQGCVERAAESGGYVLSRLNTWPIATTPVGRFGLRHFWSRSPRRFREFLGNTVQVTGKVKSMKPSEIELEPGLRRFGELVEIERPDRYLLVTPGSIGLNLDALDGRSDIPLTMIEIEIEEMLEVMSGCLPYPERY